MSIRNRLHIPATLHVWDDTGRDPATGDETGGFNAAQDRPVMCDLRQQTTTEQRGGAVVVTVSWLIFIQPDVPSIDANDQITVTGMGRWAFEGDPWLVKVPRTGRLNHWQGTVRKVG